MLRSMLMTYFFTVAVSLLSSILGGCMTVKKLDSSESSKYEGFIHDGKTTKQEVQDRLGSAQSTYENERIIVYHLVTNENGRMILKDGRKETCYACVLVFNNNNVVERHSLIKGGCKH